ncbi:hypothetical protein BDZ45DRAFT_737822 [Acephala macrosclerotiorum]|nr:hypothetical protein BDZ45DRAFT_737822 [Acephala macrosclerotiorum]
MTDFSPVIKANLDQALTYLKEVEESCPKAYQQFLTILGDFQVKSSPVKEVHDQIKVFFANNPSLIEGLEKFLPVVAPMEASADDKVEEKAKAATGGLEESKL